MGSGLHGCKLRVASASFVSLQSCPARVLRMLIWSVNVQFSKQYAKYSYDNSSFCYNHFSQAPIVVSSTLLCRRGFLFLFICVLLRQLNRSIMQHKQHRGAQRTYALCCDRSEGASYVSEPLIPAVLHSGRVLQSEHALSGCC